VLADSSITDTEDIHAVYPGGEHMPQRVRAFLDFVLPRLQQHLAPSRA
jgi:DNA-binding transcriptional LysR family regulator